MCGCRQSACIQSDEISLDLNKRHAAWRNGKTLFNHLLIDATSHSPCKAHLNLTPPNRSHAVMAQWGTVWHRVTSCWGTFKPVREMFSSERLYLYKIFFKMLLTELSKYTNYCFIDRAISELNGKSAWKMGNHSVDLVDSNSFGGNVRCSRAI